MNHRVLLLFAVMHIALLPDARPAGQLTVKGYSDSLAVGRAFKKLYIDDVHLVDPALDLTQIYVRSTNITRYGCCVTHSLTCLL